MVDNLLLSSYILLMIQTFKSVSTSLMDEVCVEIIGFVSITRKESINKTIYTKNRNGVRFVRYILLQDVFMFQ